MGVPTRPHRSPTRPHGKYHGNPWEIPWKTRHRVGGPSEAPTGKGISRGKRAIAYRTGSPLQHTQNGNVDADHLGIWTNSRPTILTLNLTLLVGRLGTAQGHHALEAGVA